MACQLVSEPENNPGTAQCVNRDEAYGNAHTLQSALTALGFTQCLNQSTWGKENLDLGRSYTSSLAGTAFLWNLSQ